MTYLLESHRLADRAAEEEHSLQLEPPEIRHQLALRRATAAEMAEVEHLEDSLLAAVGVAVAQLPMEEIGLQELRAAMAATALPTRLAGRASHTQAAAAADIRGGLEALHIRAERQAAVAAGEALEMG